MKSMVQNLLLFSLVICQGCVSFFLLLIGYGIYLEIKRFNDFLDKHVKKH